MTKGDGVEDLVTWILREVDREYPDPSSHTLLRIEQRIRLYWGGSRPYIAKGQPIASHGKVPRATFYRWVSRKS